MIHVDHLHKSFRSLHVLQDVSVELPTRSVTAIIGPNGSGKTTLMKSIVGLVQPDSGTITVDGVSTINNPQSRATIGYMSQVAHYPENLTPRDLVNMVRGIRKANVPEISDELIEDVQLHGHMDKPMRALSGGTRQKVGSVLAFMFKPTTLLLDEPTAGLDPVVTERLKERIVKVRNEGTTVLITSHVLSEIQELADRLIYLHEGQVIFDGMVDELLARTGHNVLSRAVATIMTQNGGGAT